VERRANPEAALEESVDTGRHEGVGATRGMSCRWPVAGYRQPGTGNRQPCTNLFFYKK
jgi:hypothetical protein